MKGEYISLAIRNLKKRGIRSWLTMLGIFIGIAAVVSLISLGQALQTAVTGQFGSLSTDTLTVTSAETGFGPPGSLAVRKLTDHDLDIVQSVSGIDVVIPRLVRVVRVEYNDKVNFNYIASIPEDEKQVEAIYDSADVKIARGRLLEPGEKDKVVLGSDFADTESFGKEIRVGSKLNIQGRTFEVVGFLEKTSTFTTNSAILMSEEDLKEILNIGDEIDLIVVKVRDEDQISDVADEIERRMRRDRDEDVGEEDFSVQTPIQSLEAVNTILNIVNIVVAGIALISLLVGGIGIANTMFTSVLERTREIGVMKAIGAQNKDILSIFLMEAGLLGLVGGIIGALIGLGFAFAVAGAASGALGVDFPVALSFPLLGIAIGFSLLIGVVSGIIPALQASRLRPVEALRK